MSPVTDSSAPSSCKRHVGKAGLPNGQTSSPNYSVNGSDSYHSNKDEQEEEDDDEEDDDEDENDHAVSADNSIATIYFSRTVEPKRIRINTGKNTTLKFSEKKEEAKWKRKSGAGSHSARERLPSGVLLMFTESSWRWNGEYVPRKLILKTRSQENSVCSDRSESSAADVDTDRRAPLRSPSSEEATGTEAGGSTLEEPQENHAKRPLPSGVSEAFLEL